MFTGVFLGFFGILGYYWYFGFTAPGLRPAHLVDFRGTGLWTSPRIAIPPQSDIGTVDERWEVRWRFHCGTPGSFSLSASHVIAGAPDQLTAPVVSAVGRSGSGTTRFAGGGRVRLHIATACTWAVGVFEDVAT